MARSVSGNVLGTALSFNGGTDTSVVLVPTIASQNSLTTMSYSCWVYPQGYGGGGLGRIFQKDNSTSTTYIGLIADSGLAKWKIITSFTSTDGLWTFTTPTVNLWHHIVVTYDNSSVSNNPIIYLDNVVVTVTTATVPIGSATGDTAHLYIGNRSNGNRAFQGFIDSFKMYNKILSSTEVTSLYNKQDVTSGKIADFSFDEASGVTATDSTGTANGTITIPRYTIGIIDKPVTGIRTTI